MSGYMTAREREREKKREAKQHNLAYFIKVSHLVGSEFRKSLSIFAAFEHPKRCI